jgi:uncharacterized phiE125 gp8 family phage protein
MSTVLITGPAKEPITLIQAKRQVGLSQLQDTDEVNRRMLGDVLREAIQSARAKAENDTRRVFITQTWEHYRDGFPGSSLLYQAPGYAEFYLPKPPLQSIVTFQFVDVSGAWQTFTTAPDDYQLDPGSETQPARILPPYARPWPPTRLIPRNVKVRFIAGYGDEPESIPAALLQAMKLLVKFFYDHPDGNAPDPMGYSSLISPYRNLIA